MAKQKSVIKEHILLPEHVKLTNKEKEAVLKHYGIAQRQLPKIFKNDAAIAELDAKPGDIIKIIRNSPTAGQTIFYRGVTDV